MQPLAGCATPFEVSRRRGGQQLMGEFANDMDSIERGFDQAHHPGIGDGIAIRSEQLDSSKILLIARARGTVLPFRDRTLRYPHEFRET
jgi:hypothetical protein